MTRDVSPDLQRIRLYLTAPHRCSYLPTRQATTAFVDPKLPMDSVTYSHLSDLGFRRSGQYLYTPRCGSCKSCIPVRIPSAVFAPTRQQQRTLKRNRDIDVRLCRAVNMDEHYPLYARYINTRHKNGDMYPPSKTQYQDFIGKPWDCTRFIEFRLAGTLVACAVVDWLERGLSAIYTYFDPDQSARSLGVFAILKQVELTKAAGLDYVYLGYWIRDCAKMNYKAAYRPAELYLENRWLTVR